MSARDRLVGAPWHRARAPRLCGVWLASLWVLCLAAEAQGCIAPVSYGRTGQVLEPGSARFVAATSTGIAPTVAEVDYPDRIANPEQQTPHEGTYHDYSASKARVFSWTTDAVFALPLSLEVGGAVGVVDPCEVGLSLSGIRVGVELRCGTVRGRSVGGLELAASAAIASYQVVSPRGLGARAGLDASLAGSHITPLLGLYLGLLPWSRSVEFDDPDREGEFPNHSHISSDRDEWRLSAPIGVAFRDDKRPRQMTLSLLIIPELTLSSTVTRRTGIEPAEALVSLDQTWAVLFALHVDVGFDFAGE